MKRLPLLLVVAIAGLSLLACDDTEIVFTPTPLNTMTPTATVAPTDTPAPAETLPPTEAPEPTATPTQPAVNPAPAIQAAIDALGSWLGPAGDPASIKLVSVDSVMWPDGCLGLQRAGVACSQVVVDGFRVMLGLGDATYEVRTDVTGNIVKWAPSVEIMAKFQDASPNVMQFLTDDNSSLTVRTVPGSDFGVGANQLAVGQAVGLGLADVPQGSGQLLVWVDVIH